MLTQRILRRHAVEITTGLSRSAIYKQMKAGKFPLPVQLTSRAVGWLQSDLDDWMAARPTAANMGDQP